MLKFAWEGMKCPRGFGTMPYTWRINYLPYASSVDGNTGEMGGPNLGPGWSSPPASIVTSTICGCISSFIPRVCDHRFARGRWTTCCRLAAEGESLACPGSLEGVTA